MTDNATELLRKLLDERDAEHEDSELIDHRDGTTTYYTEWGGNDDGDGANVYVEYMDGTVLRMFDATPEQAIAATLGTPISADLRTALDFMRIWITDDAHLGESAISYEFEKAEGLRKLDAIEQAIVATLGEKPCDKTEKWLLNTCNQAAQDYVTQLEQEVDELKSRLEAATLGSGTCEYVIEDNMNETEGMGDVWFRCTNCDMCFDYADDWLLKMPYCPKCGATVKGVR